MWQLLIHAAERPETRLGAQNFVNKVSSSSGATLHRHRCGWRPGVPGRGKSVIWRHVDWQQFVMMKCDPYRYWPIAGPPATIYRYLKSLSHCCWHRSVAPEASMASTGEPRSAWVGQLNTSVATKPEPRGAWLQIFIAVGIVPWFWNGLTSLAPFFVQRLSGRTRTRIWKRKSNFAVTCWSMDQYGIKVF